MKAIAIYFLPVAVVSPLAPREECAYVGGGCRPLAEREGYMLWLSPSIVNYPLSIEEGNRLNQTLFEIRRVNGKLCVGPSLHLITRFAIPFSLCRAA